MSLIPSRPSWASAFGTDEFGIFADMTVATVVQRFRYCPPGSFLMGSPEDEPGRWDDEGPRQQVTLTQGFWIGDTPVTQAFFLEVMGWNPSRFDGADHPVETVKWDEATAMAAAIDCCLPTEAQREYACRAGTTGATYDDAKPLDEFAWFYANSNNQTQPIKQKRPNPWGLYDTLGNVYEWCRDSPRHYTTTNIIDPCEMCGGDRVIRGGSWYSLARFVRAAYRYGLGPGHACDDLGFRLCRTIE